MTNDKDDRDATIGKLLPRTMARASEEPAGGCLDADTLAAWADAALDTRERAAAEAHAARCARCQLILATMAKIGPTAPAARWRMPSLGWLVPFAAAAAAVIVWIVVPLRERPGNVRQVSQIADATPPPAGAPAPEVVAPPAESAAGSRMPREREAPRQATGVEGDKKVAEAAAQPAVTAPSAGPSPQPPAAPPATALPSATSVARVFSLVARERVVVSPNPASRWRILPGGAVQRSADGGSTWETQNTGVNETLSAGASPSPSVCWLVGPGGIVLLSTDGRAWRRVAFPEAVQLVAVRATDDLAATVTTADGREFVTEDGGRTWARAAGR